MLRLAWHCLPILRSLQGLEKIVIMGVFNEKGGISWNFKYTESPVCSWKLWSWYTVMSTKCRLNS